MEPYTKEEFAECAEYINVSWDVFQACPLEAQQALMNAAWTSRRVRVHEGRVRSAVEWARGIEATRAPRQVMTRVLNEPPRRFKGVPESFDKSCEFANLEPSPRSMVGGRVLAFRRETLDSFGDEIRAMLQTAADYDATHDTQCAYTSYACLHIWAGGQRRLGTRTIALTMRDLSKNLDYLYYEEFEPMVADIEQAQHYYEVVFEAAEPCYVHFYFKVQHYLEPGCWASWGDRVKTVEDFKLFDLFTANEAVGDCVLQCARRVWGPDATEDCIAAFIARADAMVVILTPRAYVQDIYSISNYGDLSIDPLSPVKTLSVIDPSMIYLLHWRGHIGVMENLKSQPVNPMFTRFRPLHKFPNCERLTVCFDIECYFDPASETKHVPYLCCACFVYDDVPGNVMEFEGRDCVAQMVEWAAETARDIGLDSVELIAHNGGGYDFHYILSSMHNPSAVTNILVRNNHFVGFSFVFNDVDFSVKDSLNFVLCSLSKAARAFLSNSKGKDDGSVVLNKTDFPHHEVRSSADLQRTFQEWVAVEQNVNTTVQKERMLVTVDHIVRFKENGHARKLIDWAREYCCNDVIVLAHVWVRFKNTVAEVFNCRIVDQTHTLAGMSFRLFEAHLPVGVKLHHPLRKDFVNMRAALIGGRCISMNGLWHDVACLDVKSLYPAAMAFYDQPYGPYHRVKDEVPGELGIYRVRVIPSRNCEESGSFNFGFFPLRTQSEDVTYRPDGSAAGEYVAWYTSVDIAIGREEGHTIVPVAFDDVGGYVGYVWRRRGKIFAEYVQGVLYRLKLQYEQAGDAEKRHVIKIIMNSLWGKFAQKWMDTQYRIVREEEADLVANRCFKVWDTDHMLVKSTKPKTRSSKPVQNGVFVLSWARWHMKKLWTAVATSPGAVCLYSDTDSMMVRADEIALDATVEINGCQVPAIGSELGQLECEQRFEDLICVGKKQYMGKCNGGGSGEPVYKFRFKGVPQNCIKPDMYAYLLENPDNRAQIEFLKFRREWGAVHGYIESKVVSAT
ncbi:hypothetical protein IWW48_006309 [Coemansia sp. RSA 1200]|nr:hypothetical protein IWW48_006309 [Coemansia sp. RSA 1200]